MGLVSPGEAFAGPGAFAGAGRVVDAVNEGSEMRLPSLPGLAPGRPGVAACRNCRLPRLPENRSR